VYQGRLMVLLRSLAVARALVEVVVQDWWRQNGPHLICVMCVSHGGEKCFCQEKEEG
jgi:hypothetical protein